MKWRWDQGRLDYFTFDKMRIIASVLAMHEGTFLNRDEIREPLQNKTQLPFSPSRYTVWRNYARTFKCMLLAARIGEKLVCTRICRALAGGLLSANDYFAHLVRCFYFSAPMFSGYDSSSERVFPFCAVLKFLFAKGPQGASLDQIIRHLAINPNITGKENIEFYFRLTEREGDILGEQKRQIREMLIAISQFYLLKWRKGKMHLDIAEFDSVARKMIEQVARPIESKRESDPDAEVLNLGNTIRRVMPFPAESPIIVPDEDGVFLEGSRIMSHHYRIERSRILRSEFFNQPTNRRCNMSGLDASGGFPWVSNLLEIHHLLPLASAVSVNREGTSLADLVALTPSCHKAVHVYYRQWLRENCRADFESKEEAKFVYNEARAKYQEVANG